MFRASGLGFRVLGLTVLGFYGLGSRLAVRPGVRVEPLVEWPGVEISDLREHTRRSLCGALVPEGEVRV